MEKRPFKFKNFGLSHDDLLITEWLLTCWSSANSFLNGKYKDKRCLVGKCYEYPTLIVARNAITNFYTKHSARIKRRTIEKQMEKKNLPWCLPFATKLAKCFFWRLTNDNCIYLHFANITFTITMEREKKKERKTGKKLIQILFSYSFVFSD